MDTRLRYRKRGDITKSDRRRSLAWKVSSDGKLVGEFHGADMVSVDDLRWENVIVFSRPHSCQSY